MSETDLRIRKGRKKMDLTGCEIMEGAYIIIQKRIRNKNGFMTNGPSKMITVLGGRYSEVFDAVTNLFKEQEEVNCND